jgi:hypothetical protein
METIIVKCGTQIVCLTVGTTMSPPIHGIQTGTQMEPQLIRTMNWAVRFNLLITTCRQSAITVGKSKTRNQTYGTKIRITRGMVTWTWTTMVSIVPLRQFKTITGWTSITLNQTASTITAGTYRISLIDVICIIFTSHTQPTTVGTYDFMQHLLSSTNICYAKKSQANAGNLND